MQTFPKKKKKKKPKTKAVPKKHFYSHYLHFCLKMHVYSAKRTKYMFLCSNVPVDDDSLNKVSSITKHYSVFQLFTLQR